MHLTMNIFSMVNIFNLFKAMKTTAEKIKAVFGFIILCVEFLFFEAKKRKIFGCEWDLICVLRFF